MWWQYALTFALVILGMYTLSFLAFLMTDTGARVAAKVSLAVVAVLIVLFAVIFGIGSFVVWVWSF